MKIISIFLFLLGWTSAFAFHQWVPIPMFLGLLICLATILVVIKDKKIDGLGRGVVILTYFSFSLWSYRFYSKITH